MDWDGDTLITR